MSKTAMCLLASKPRIMSTIYGECDVELGATLGPVSITFSIELLSLISLQHHVVPQPSSNQAFVSSMPLSPFPRLATSSLLLSGHLHRCESDCGWQWTLHKCQEQISIQVVLPSNQGVGVILHLLHIHFDLVKRRAKFSLPDVCWPVMFEIP